MLAALSRAEGGRDARALDDATRVELRRRAFGDGRRGDTPEWVRRRLVSTGAIVRRPNGAYAISPRGRRMATDPDSWMPGDVMPVTESEMLALRGYERLNAWIVAIIVFALGAFALDGRHASFVHLPNAPYVSAQLDAFLRVVLTLGIGLFIPLIVLLVSERGSDWIALVTRRYRRATILSDPFPDR